MSITRRPTDVQRPVVYMPFSYSRPDAEPVVKLDELRAHFERVIAPLLRTDSQAK